MIVCCIQWGSTPLHYACLSGHKDVALMLIERGANVTEKNVVRISSYLEYSNLTNNNNNNKKKKKKKKKNNNNNNNNKNNNNC